MEKIIWRFIELDFQKFIAGSSSNGIVFSGEEVFMLGLIGWEETMYVSCIAESYTEV